MLLEAILRRIYNGCMEAKEHSRGSANVCDLGNIEYLANILLDVHPKKPEKPRNIFVWWSNETACLRFTFEYMDRSKNRDLSYKELHRYFCTVLEKA